MHPVKREALPSRSKKVPPACTYGVVVTNGRRKTSGRGVLDPESRSADSDSVT